MLEVREVPGKGRGLFAARSIKGGEVVLQEHPILLYPQQSAIELVCSHCLRGLQLPGNNVTLCPTCSSAAFCSPLCAAAAAADPGSHCAQVCRWLAACNFEGLSDEQQTELQLLFRLISVLQAAAAGVPAALQRQEQMQHLASGPTGAPVAVTTPRQELHGRVCHALAAAGAAELAASLSVQQVAEILARDETNGYGILLPARGPERRLRGSGLYAQASLINHECLPNVARFDAFDAGMPSVPGSNTAVQLRALHDIPAGEEITQSYFPLPWPYHERLERCQQQYGFTCVCPRCKEEASWEEEQEEDAMGEGPIGSDLVAASFSRGHEHGHVHEHPHQQHPHQQQQQAIEPEEQQPDAGYISLFLMKFVCPDDECLGTMAPLQPGSDVCECNVCGRQRSEAEFLASLETEEAEVDDENFD